MFRPDATTDSTIRRRQKTRRRIGDGVGLIPRLIVATDHAPLAWLVVPLGKDGGLYTRETARKAREVSLSVTGTAPAWVVLQRGREGGLHANIVMSSVQVPEDLPKGTHRQIVEDLEGLASYLAGPADQAVCPVKNPRTGIKTPPTLEALERADREYLEARAAAPGRLPRMSWTPNLPRLKVTAGDLPLPDDLSPQDQARYLSEHGVSRPSIARRLGVSVRTVQRWLNTPKNLHQ